MTLVTAVFSCRSPFAASQSLDVCVNARHTQSHVRAGSASVKYVLIRLPGSRYCQHMYRDLQQLFDFGFAQHRLQTPKLKPPSKICFRT